VATSPQVLRDLGAFLWAWWLPWRETVRACLICVQASATGPRGGVPPTRGHVQGATWLLAAPGGQNCGAPRPAGALPRPCPPLVTGPGAREISARANERV